MLDNTKPIVPAFRVTINGGLSWRSDKYGSLGHHDDMNTFFSDTWNLPNALKEMSLDGTNFHSMEEVRGALGRKEKVLILEGHEYLGDFDEFGLTFCDEQSHDIHVMDCVYAYPQQLRNLNAINPDYIYIMTTGLYVDHLKQCIEWFYRSKHKPKKVVFHAGGSLDKMIEFAYDLIKKYNTRIYVDMRELEEQDWMYEIMEGEGE
jgi:hypothetical protein